MESDICTKSLSLSVYIYFSNHFCFQVYFLIISAFDFYLMMYLNVCPGVFGLCSILKIFLHIFLLLLNIFLFIFMAFPQRGL